MPENGSPGSEIGGNFRVQGATAYLSKRGGRDQATVIAAWGRNLHGSDIAPALARAQFSAVRDAVGTNRLG